MSIGHKKKLCIQKHVCYNISKVRLIPSEEALRYDIYNKNTHN